jgi:hypothetical protein
MTAEGLSDDAPPRRARTMAEMRRQADRLMRPGDFDRALAAYRPRPGDVIISPFAKCGTTWLQQTFHTLRTRGDMDFDDISRVVPWIETACAVGIDLEAPQRAEPRGFKSHLPYENIPKGARYVVALRDPGDALVSMHRFMEGWHLEPGCVTIDQFAPAWAAGMTGSSYWRHLLSWWSQRNNPDVLLLSYEHMSADPAWAIRRLAAFCGIPLDDALLALTLERSSLAFMLRHKDRFDDLLMRQASEARCGLPPGSDAAKVRAGQIGDHRREFTPETTRRMAATWAKLVTPILGFPDYPALEAALRAHNAG